MDQLSMLPDPQLAALGRPTLSVLALGDPVPWARARGGSEFGGFYTPKRQRAYRAHVRAEAHVAMLQRRWRRPLTGPLALSIRVFIAPPARVMMDNEQAAHAAAGGWCVEPPDMDNWMKLPMDAMSRLVYDDDARVCAFVGCGKWYSVLRPRLEIDLWMLA